MNVNGLTGIEHLALCSVTVCMRAHALGLRSFSCRAISLTQRHEKTLDYHNGDNPMSLSHMDSIGTGSGQKDKRRDGRTNRITIGNTRYQYLQVVARENRRS